MNCLDEETKSLRKLYDLIENTERYKGILLKIKSRCGRGFTYRGDIRRFLVINEPSLDVELNLNQRDEPSVDYIVYNWGKQENVGHIIYRTDKKDPKEIYMNDPYTEIVAGKLLDLFKIIEQQDVFYC